MIDPESDDYEEGYARGLRHGAIGANIENYNKGFAAGIEAAAKAICSSCALKRPIYDEHGEWRHIVDDHTEECYSSEIRALAPQVNFDDSTTEPNPPLSIIDMSGGKEEG